MADNTVSSGNQVTIQQLRDQVEANLAKNPDSQTDARARNFLITMSVFDGQGNHDGKIDTKQEIDSLAKAIAVTLSDKPNKREEYTNEYASIIKRTGGDPQKLLNLLMGNKDIHNAGQVYANARSISLGGEDFTSNHMPPETINSVINHTVPTYSAIPNPDDPKPIKIAGNPAPGAPTTQTSNPISVSRQASVTPPASTTIPTPQPANVAPAEQTQAPAPAPTQPPVSTQNEPTRYTHRHARTNDPFSGYYSTQNNYAGYNASDEGFFGGLFHKIGSFFERLFEGLFN